MKSHSVLPVFVLIVLSCGTCSCKNATEPQNKLQGITLYSNSFESVSDTIGWSGYGALLLKDDAAPEGGNSSLFVSGGCMVPHAVYDLPAAESDGYYRIACWGKNLAQGGGVELKAAKASGKGVEVAVTEKDWTSYASADSIFCPVGDHLRIEMICGGIVYSAMLVDLIEVVRVN